MINILKTMQFIALAFVMEMWHIGAAASQPILALSAPMDADGIYSESYPWAMALSAHDLWVGTGANVLCGGANPGRKAAVNSFLPPRKSAVIRCDKTKAFDGAPFDWRPPAIWRVNRSTLQSVHVDVDTSTALGFRSAGVIGDRILLISEGVRGTRDFGVLLVYIFSDQGRFLGITRLSNGHSGNDGNLGLAMPRNGVTFHDRYYFPFQDKSEGQVMHVGVLDSRGRFERKGRFNARGGVVGLWRDRLVFGTWGDRIEPAGIFLSPPWPFDGGSWKKVFSFNDYDPDPGAALTYDTGALAQAGDWLYFGSINGPLLAAINEIKVNGPLPNPANAVLGERSIAVFRAKDLDQAPTVELLYGARRLPAHVSPVPENAPIRPGLWIIKKTGMTPKCGPSGFGNPNNRYTWSMAALNDRVYVGTMDMTTTLFSTFLTQKPNPGPVAGGDLYALDAQDGCGEAITTNGFGNPYVYGFRNLLPAKEGLWIGGANPFNKTGGFTIWLLRE